MQNCIRQVLWISGKFDCGLIIMHFLGVGGGGVRNICELHIFFLKFHILHHFSVSSNCRHIGNLQTSKDLFLFAALRDCVCN